LNLPHRHLLPFRPALLIHLFPVDLSALQLFLPHLPLPAINLLLSLNLAVHLVFPLEARRTLIHTRASKGAFLYGMTRGPLDHLPREASIYYHAVDSLEIGHPVRVLEQLSVPHSREYEPANVGAVKIAITGKAEEPHWKGGESADPDKGRRQWSPANKPVAVDPIDPRRAPLGAGDPCPPVSRIEEPPPVMAGRPAPRVVRDPRPSGISVFP
jgi:hypothetical protein